MNEQMRRFEYDTPKVSKKKAIVIFSLIICAIAWFYYKNHKDVVYAEEAVPIESERYLTIVPAGQTEEVRVEVVGWVLQYNDKKTGQTMRQWHLPGECTGCSWETATNAIAGVKIVRMVTDKYLAEKNDYNEIRYPE